MIQMVSKLPVRVKTLPPIHAPRKSASSCENLTMPDRVTMFAGPTNLKLRAFSQRLSLALRQLRQLRHPYLQPLQINPQALNI